jgi:hypothetical protein
MIQRVQSIFLLLIGVCMIVAIAIPSWEKVNEATGERAVLDGISLEYLQNGEVIQSTPTWYITVLAIGSALIAFYSLAQFRNRLLQIKLGALNSLVMAGVLGLILYFSNQGEKLFVEPVQGTYEIGFYLPIFAIVFNMLANRFIRRDENLVRSADRMR